MPKEKGDKRTLIQKAIRLVKQFLLIKLCLCVCLSAYYSLNAYRKSGASATAFLTLNFVNAANGLYPNGTRINIYDLVTDDILTMTLAKAGLQDDITIQQLAACISIQPRYVRTASQGFVSTEWRITISYNRPSKHVSAKSLAQLLCASYVENFEKTYLNNAVLNEFKLGDLATYDYNEITMLYETKAAMLRDYLVRRSNENAIFRASSTGETFQSLIDKLDTLSSVQLENYNAYITRTGATRSNGAYESEMNYRLDSLTREQTNADIDYNVRLEAIRAYDPNQNNAILIASYDSTNNFYMSRTKTGVDDIAMKAINFAQSAQTIGDSIFEIKDRLSQMGNATAATLLKANKLAESLQQEYNTLLKSAKSTDDTYIMYTSERVVSYSGSSAALSDQLQMSKSMTLAAGAFCALNIAQLFVLLLFRRGRKADGYVRA